MKTMGEILAEHQQWVSGSCGLEDECNCGFELRHVSIQAHQADMLSTAGFGPIRETADRVGGRYAKLHQMLRDELQAQAWDAGYNAGWDDAREDWGKSPNPYRTKGAGQ